jgi:hypothetical protein
MPPEAQMTADSSQPTARNWLQYLVIGVLFGVVALTFVRGWNELAGYQWQIDHLAAVEALGLWAATTLAAGFCWLVVTRAFGLRLPIGPALRVYCTSNLGKYLPGKVLHVLARVYLVQQQGVPVAVGTASAALDVILYVAAGLVVSIFALPTALGGDQPVVMAGAGMAVLVGLALLHPRSLEAVAAVGGRVVPRLRGLQFEVRYQTILAAFVMYLLLWVLVTAAVYFSVRSVASLGAERAPLLGAVFAFAYIAGLLTPTPGGVGGREAVMISLLSQFIPLPAAVVATIINRLLQIVAEAMCAGLLSVVVRR